MDNMRRDKLFQQSWVNPVKMGETALVGSIIMQVYYLPRILV
jgi:hypothetical protein